MSQDGLFPLPAGTGSKDHTRRNSTGRAVYQRVHLRRRILCADCILDIHQRGMDVAPPPRSVRWRRKTVDGVRELCQQHKDEWLEADRRENRR